MTVNNLAALHRRQAERFGPRPAVRYKRHGLYRDYSWDLYLADALACAAGLVEAGLQPGDRVGMVAENRLEWLACDMGILAAATVNVPAHATLSAKQIRDQFAHAEVSWVFVSNRAQLDKALSFRREIPGIRGVVVFDEVAEEGVLPWSGFLTRGRRWLERHRAELDRRCDRLGRGDLATIMYTSGTTGNPKGVMLTHWNLLSNALAMTENFDLNQDSIVLSWLPYSHIYGRLVDHYTHLAAACTLCLAESQETLITNLEETQPTSLAAVPRFWEKVLAACLSPDPKETARKLRRVFGPRIQWLNSGGAPLPLHVAQAYTDAGLAMLQGYGLTETSPVITFNLIATNRLGTVGRPVPGVEIRIAPDGEVLCRGPNVMVGYWKNPEATAEVVRDGWFHTGDLGEIDADGYLKITGRKKDLLVLSNGKKVIPTDLEGMLLAEECIDQCLVYGEGKHYLTALIVPNFPKLAAAARAEGVVETDPARLVADPRVKALMKRKVDAALANAAGWEQVQKFILLPRPFTQEAEELTVSLKMRRGVIFKKYGEQLEALYRE
jgi:long-chain acyl-CoA synthetase